MKIWISIALVFSLIGGGFGYLISEKLSSDARIQELTDRLAALETTQSAQALQTPARAAPPVQRRLTEVSIEGSPVRGPEDAPITIVEFSDFQCPFCSRVHPTLQRLLASYSDDVRLVFKHKPLPMHPDAMLAHRASIAADQQGRFWEMHDQIFANIRDLSRATLIEYARELTLDLPRFLRDLDNTALTAQIDRDLAESDRLGITGTPTFVINGHRLTGAQPYENFQTLIDRELARGQ